MKILTYFQPLWKENLRTSLFFGHLLTNFIRLILHVLLDHLRGFLGLLLQLLNGLSQLLPHFWFDGARFSGACRQQEEESINRNASSEDH